MNLEILLCILVTVHEFVATLTNQAYSNKFEFSLIVNRTEFIDKTMLVKSIFETESKKIVITTPHRTGKSTNIAMLKMFLELETYDGEPITKSKDLRTPVKDTSNYEFFVNSNLKISKDKKVMDYYFGKFPILIVDFKCNHKIKDSEDSVVCFREIIHEAFLDHRYLRRSEKLNTKERRYVKKWCDNCEFQEFFGQDVTNSLYKLVVLLYKHYDGREAMVLIDNYDFPTVSSMPGLKDGDEYNRVVRFNMGIISKLLTADYKYFEKAVVVGNSYVAAGGIYRIEDAKYFRFLENHPFLAYFSVTKSEVKKLYFNPAFNLTQSSILSAQDFYGGFTSISGQTFHNMHSVMKFLHFGKTENYCLQPRVVRNLGNLLKINFIQKNIESLVRGEDLAVTMYENITVYDIMYLSNAIANKYFDDHFNVNLLFYFLLEHGYLTYSCSQNESSNQNTTYVRLPNRETRTKISLKLKEYYDKFYVFDKTHLRKCARFFHEISSTTFSNLARYKTGLYWFYKSFEELIRQTFKRFRKLILDDVKKIVFSVVYELVAKSNSEFYLDFQELGGIMKFILVKGKQKYLVEFMTNKTSTFVLTKMVEEKYNELTGSVDTSGCLLIGLGVSIDLHPSISLLTSGMNITDAVHIP